MNHICPRSGKSGIAPVKIPVVFLLIIIVQICGLGNSLYAQNDSLGIIAVPLADIATTVAGDRFHIRDLLVEEVQVSTSSKMVPQIDSLEIGVAQLVELSDHVLDSRLEYSYYNSLILRWRRIESIADPLQETLYAYLARGQEINTELESAKSKWDLTLKETNSAVLSEDIISRITGIHQYIDSARNILSDSLNSSLALQNRVTDLNLIVESYLHEITELQKVELGKSLLTKDVSIFNIKRSPDSLYIQRDRTFLLNMGIQDSKVYLGKEWPTLLVLMLSFFGLLFGFIFLKRVHTPLGSDADQHEWHREKVLTKPIATAFIFTMLLALWWLPERPVFLKEIFMILFILPFLPIFRLLTFKASRFILPYLFGILLYNILNDYLQTGAVYLRISSLLESIALFSFHIYFLIAKKRVTRETREHFFYKLLNAIQPFYLLLTLLAVMANIMGYWNYANLVNNAVLLSLILLLLLATGFFSLTAVIHLFFRTRSADKSLILKDNKMGLYKWLFRYLRIGVVILWATYTLRFFYLWNPFLTGVNKVLDLGYEFGTLTLSIRGILSFVLVIYLSWLVSFIIRNLLEIELFGRLKLPRGVPKAVSSLTQYFLITLGFMLALSAAGFTMQNLGLLAGALGVGIGFGLQNIVNNFISGLILAFERPVTVGDIIIVAGHEGVVQRIGIRASVIKQYDGSEVIVPNSELISNRVINWTLAKYSRRMILTVNTHLEADTDLVLKIMKEAAYKVELVLKDPEAKSYFNGIKDRELDFALYYWASGNILDCKSLVNQEVQKALKEADIDFVMPLHVLMQEGKKSE